MLQEMYILRNRDIDQRLSMRNIWWRNLRYKAACEPITGEVDGSVEVAALEDELVVEGVLDGIVHGRYEAQTKM